MFLMGTVLTSQLYTGLTSDEASDAEREWAARSNAWVMIISIAWMVSSATVLFGPHLIEGLWQKLTVLGVGGISSWITVALGSKTADTTVASRRKPTPCAARRCRSRCRQSWLSDHRARRGERWDAESHLRQQQRRHELNRNPPSEDSTSVPMLRFLAKRRNSDLIWAESVFVSMLGADSARIPRTVDEIAATRAVDAQVIVASDSLTAAALASDSVITRLIRRSGDTTSALLNTYDDTRAFTAFRTFTAHRAAPNSGRQRDGELPVAAPETTAEMARGVELVLQTDTALKNGFIQREAAANGIGAIADSIRKAQTRHQPSENALWIGVLVVHCFNKS